METKKIKLYDLPSKTPLILPIGKDDLRTKTKPTRCLFHHIDGMYSYITVEEGPHKGAVVHLAAVCPMKKVGDHYEMENV